MAVSHVLWQPGITSRWMRMLCLLCRVSRLVAVVWGYGHRYLDAVHTVATMVDVAALSWMVCRRFVGRWWRFLWGCGVVCFSVFARCGVAEGFSRLGSVGRCACVAVLLGRSCGGFLWWIRPAVLGVEVRKISEVFSSVLGQSESRFLRSFSPVFGSATSGYSFGFSPF